MKQVNRPPGRCFLCYHFERSFNIATNVSLSKNSDELPEMADHEFAEKRCLEAYSKALKLKMAYKQIIQVYFFVIHF